MSPVEACAFGPEGEHHDGELVTCDGCDRPTCDYCGFGHNDVEDDWLCPDCLPALTIMAEVGLDAMLQVCDPDADHPGLSDMEVALTAALSTGLASKVP